METWGSASGASPWCGSLKLPSARFIVSSVDVPVTYQLVRATVGQPFLCVRLALDPVSLAPLVPKIFPNGLPSKSPSASIGVTSTDPGIADSAAVGIARAIAWLKENYAQTVKIDDLARLAFMSVSSFHQHFRSVTAQSPLQYQKAMRLQEARSLMLAGLLEAGEAAVRVGYVSQSQFMREYGRYFGQSPTRDVALVRGQPLAVSA